MKEDNSMSTDYYLSNIKDKNIKRSLNDLISLQLQNFKSNLISFGKENDLFDFEEDVNKEISIITNSLKWKLFFPEEISICRITSDKLIWYTNGGWNKEKKFIEFYNKNSSKYIIENEYNVVLTLDEFLNEIHKKKREIYIE